MQIIQTDAAISPGISGGALLNSRGELVGIPALGVLLYEGLNFAIPVNTMRDVAAELIEYGKVRKPSIGIYYTVQDGPDEPLKNYLPAGLLVGEVGADTACRKRGYARGRRDLLRRGRARKERPRSCQRHAGLHGGRYGHVYRVPLLV